MPNKNTNLKNAKVKPIPVPQAEIGIDVDGTFVDNLIEGSQIGSVDLSSIDALNQSAQSRERMYELIDSMATDDIISAVIETYAEDAIQTNDKGQIVWIESSDKKVLDYTTWLLDSLNIDKQIYKWAYCLVTYGDVYVRMYRKSDYGNDLLFRDNKRTQKLNEIKDKVNGVNPKEALNEDVKLMVYSQNDPYIPYVEMVANPGEMFDLQKFGKTHGYVKASTRVVQTTSDELYQYLTRYKMKQNDIEIFDAMSFAHGCLETTNQRQPETVDIFLDSAKTQTNEYGEVIEDSHEDSMTTSYSVKRGQSILYNSFRIWRELNLLEMSALLNRLTKSSLVRILNVEVGDMPKEQVRAYIQRLKEKIEQKSAIDVNKSMQSYTNPGPIENTIYVPTHEGKGTITPSSIGGDFDPKALTDIEYFRDKLFGSLKVPKQFFGFTEDGAGFNGGQSLTVISQRYSKTIRKIQNVLCQLVTDIINLFLIDRGLDLYVNKFQVKMQEPATQEQKDRREATDNRIRYISDVMNQLTDVDDKVIKLKIYKALISSSVNDPEVISLLESYIDSLEPKEEASKEQIETSGGSESSGGGLDLGADSAPTIEPPADNNDSLPEVPLDMGGSEPVTPEAPMEAFSNDEDKDILLEDEDADDSYLPSAEDLGVDLTDGVKVKK